MGFLLPAMTQEKLDNQRDVVKNERRQNYENRPYGQATRRIGAALYPPDHPYSWTTIGSQEDLSGGEPRGRQALLPALVRPEQRDAGDRRRRRSEAGARAGRALVRAHPARTGGRAAGAAAGASSSAEKRVVLEDHVKLPQLSITWPTVEDGHRRRGGARPAGARSSPSNKRRCWTSALTMDEQLASQVRAYAATARSWPATFDDHAATARAASRSTRSSERVQELLARPRRERRRSPTGSQRVQDAPRGATSCAASRPSPARTGRCSPTTTPSTAIPTARQGASRARWR